MVMVKSMKAPLFNMLINYIPIAFHVLEAGS